MKKLAVVVVAALVAAVAISSTRVSVVRHWGLYAATGPGKPYQLFIDPFPDAKTCSADATQIVRAGGRAYCRDRLELSFDPKREEELFWEYLSAGNPWSRLCGHRRPVAV